MYFYSIFLSRSPRDNYFTLRDESRKSFFFPGKLLKNVKRMLKMIRRSLETVKFLASRSTNKSNISGATGSTIFSPILLSTMSL